MENGRNVIWHRGAISRAQREGGRHRSAVVWFTGLSGSGKSTLAHALEEWLVNSGLPSYVLDGDNVRHGLCADLGFSEVDRHENIRRIGEVARLFVDAGVVVLTAFISPFHADRARVRALLPAEDFIEVWCHCPLDVCESRDVKGLYRRARAGEIPDFTGISSPYEVPEAADLALDTAALSVEECLERLQALLRSRGVLPAV